MVFTERSLLVPVTFSDLTVASCVRADGHLPIRAFPETYREIS